MFAKVSVSKGNILLPLISGNCLKVCEYKIMPPVSNRCHFEEWKSYDYQFTGELPDVNWYGISVVADHQSNLLQCFLGVKFQNAGAKLFFCMENKNCLKEVINIEANPIGDNADMYVVDGPSLLMIGSMRLSIISPVYKIEKNYDMSLYLPRKYDKHKCLMLQCLHDQVAMGFHIVLYIFTLLSYTTTEKQLTVSASCFVTKNTVCSDQFFLVPVENFCPMQIGQTTMNVDFKDRFSILQSLQNGIPLRELPWINNSTILCTTTELLIFDKSVLMHKCDIPFANTCKISSLSSRTFESKTFNMFLESPTDGVCYITYKEEMKQLQFKKKWPAAQHALLGDFRRNGSKQVLLIFDDSYECWQIGCSLLHILSFSESLSEETEIPDEHLATTITALNKRVTMGAAAIADAHYKIAQKNAAISEVFGRIVRHASKTEPDEEDDSCLQSNLLDIIISEDDKGQICKKSHSKGEKLALVVLSTWKVPLGDQWILGWRLQNVSNGPVTNVNVSIIMADESLEYKQKVFKENIFAEDVGFFEPEETFFCVVALKTVTFKVDPVKLSCVLCWSMGKDSENDFLFPNGASLPCQQFPMTSSISVKEMFDRKIYNGLPDTHRLMCHRISRENVSLILTAETSDLTDFCDILCRSDINVRKLQVNDKNCILFEEGSPLNCVNLVYELSKSFVNVDVFIRSIDEAVLLVQWLYSVLPEDVIILPKTFTDEEKHGLQVSLLKAMKDEVDLLKTFMMDPNTDFESNSSILTDITTQSSLEGRKITLKKGTYRRMRELLVKREFHTDNVAKTISKFF